MSEEREPTHLREHDTYRQDHWSVLDIEGVDKTFATGDPDGQECRIDMDGVAAASSMRDLAEEGENINISAWLSLADAVKLRDQLDEAIQETREAQRRGDQS